MFIRSQPVRRGPIEKPLVEPVTHQSTVGELQGFARRWFSAFEFQAVSDQVVLIVRILRVVLEYPMDRLIKVVFVGLDWLKIYGEFRFLDQAKASEFRYLSFAYAASATVVGRAGPLKTIFSS